MSQGFGMSGSDTIGAEAWPTYALPFGTTINGYRIQRVLGSGGFGITYLATDLLSQQFAVKEYFPRQFAVRQDRQVVAASVEDAALFEECKDRFLREAKALVLLSRAAENRGSIVRVQTYFESHGTCFLVMDYLEGANLASVLRQNPHGLSAARLHSVLRQLLSSVRVVHRAGLMHRDIKPANIILRDDDTVVLIDFGATRETTNRQATAFTQIYSGGFAPPEQMLGLPQAEFSDIYAIGAVGYRGLGGQPVNALARKNAVGAGLADPQPSAGKIGSGRYPAKLLAAIDEAMAIEPRRRLQNVDDMLAALGQPIDEEPTIIASGSAPRRGRRLGLWGIAAVVALIGISIGVGGMLLRRHAPEPIANQQPSPSSPQQVAAGAPAPAPALEQPQPPPVPAAASQQPLIPPPAEQPAKPEPPAAPQVAAQQNAAAAPVEPTVPQPQPQSHQEAMSLPPVAQPPQPLQPYVSPLERAQAAAAAVPCAALAITEEPAGLRVSGFAGPGPDLDRLLSDLRQTGNVTNAVTGIDRAFCAPATAIAQAARRGWSNTPATPTMSMDRQRVAEGATLRLDVETQSPTLLLDLYQTDGTVRHLRTSNGHAEWVAKGPPGPRLLTAISSANPLYAGARPEVEKVRDYLGFLRPYLSSPGSTILANLAIVSVSPGSAAVIKVPQRPEQKSARCVNIVSRAQMGETLTDAELAALRTECRN
jgi:serine/threonine protein kinase